MFSTFSTLVISRFFRKTSSDNKLSNSLLSLTRDYGCAVLYFVCAHYAIVWRHAPFQPVLSAPVEHQSPLAQNQTATLCHRRAHRNRQGLCPALLYPEIGRASCRERV